MSIAVDNSLAAFVLAALVDPTKPALVPVKPPTMLRWALDKVVKVVAWAVSTNPTNIEFVGSDQKTTDEAKKYLEIDLNCEEWKFTYNDKKAVGVTLKIYTSDEFEAAQKKQSGDRTILGIYKTAFTITSKFGQILVLSGAVTDDEKWKYSNFINDILKREITEEM